MNRFARTLCFLLVTALLATGGIPMNLCLCQDGHVAVDTGCAGDCRDTGADGQMRTDSEILFVNSDGVGECLCIPISAEVAPMPASLSTKILPAKPLFCGNPQVIALYGRTVIKDPDMLSPLVAALTEYMSEKVLF